MKKGSRTYGLAARSENGGVAAFDRRDLSIDPSDLGILHPHVRPHDDVYWSPLFVLGAGD